MIRAMALMSHWKATSPRDWRLTPTDAFMTMTSLPQNRLVSDIRLEMPLTVSSRMKLTTELNRPMAVA